METSLSRGDTIDFLAVHSEEQVTISAKAFPIDEAVQEFLLVPVGRGGRGGDVALLKLVIEREESLLWNGSLVDVELLLHGNLGNRQVERDLGSVLSESRDVAWTVVSDYSNSLSRRINWSGSGHGKVLVFFRGCSSQLCKLLGSHTTLLLGRLPGSILVTRVFDGMLLLDLLCTSSILVFDIFRFRVPLLAKDDGDVIVVHVGVLLLQDGMEVLAVENECVGGTWDSASLLSSSCRRSIDAGRSGHRRRGELLRGFVGRASGGLTFRLSSTADVDQLLLAVLVGDSRRIVKGGTGKVSDAKSIVLADLPEATSQFVNAQDSNLLSHRERNDDSIVVGRQRGESHSPDRIDHFGGRRALELRDVVARHD
jgi:hypothetical protein